MVFGPLSVATLQTVDVAITHFLNIVGRECRAKATAAIKHEAGRSVGYPAFDVTFDNAFGEVNSLEM